MFGLISTGCALICMHAAPPVEPVAWNLTWAPEQLASRFDVDQPVHIAAVDDRTTIIVGTALEAGADAGGPAGFPLMIIADDRWSIVAERPILPEAVRAQFDRADVQLCETDADGRIFLAGHGHRTPGRPVLWVAMFRNAEPVYARALAEQPSKHSIPTAAIIDGDEAVIGSSSSRHDVLAVPSLLRIDGQGEVVKRVGVTDRGVAKVTAMTFDDSGRLHVAVEIGPAMGGNAINSESKLLVFDETLTVVGQRDCPGAIVDLAWHNGDHHMLAKIRFPPEPYSVPEGVYLCSVWYEYQRRPEACLARMDEQGTSIRRGPFSADYYAADAAHRVIAPDLDGEVVLYRIATGSASSDLSTYTLFIDRFEADRFERVEWSHATVPSVPFATSLWADRSRCLFTALLAAPEEPPRLLIGRFAK